MILFRKKIKKKKQYHHLQTAFSHPYGSVALGCVKSKFFQRSLLAEAKTCQYKDCYTPEIKKIRMKRYYSYDKGW